MADRLPAIRTKLAHQPLCHHAVKAGDKIIRIDTHVQETAEDIKYIVGVHRGEIAASLAEADAVWLYQPDDLDWDLREVAATLIRPVSVSADLDELVAAVVAWARPGDRVVVMSNGGFGGIHARLLDKLQSLQTRDLGANKA